jgi:hypothetical protein
MQLPLTPDQLPVDWQVTRGAPLLPALKPGAHVAVQFVPTALLLEQLNVALGGLVGFAEHNTAAEMHGITGHKEYAVKVKKR